jgi:hypothetical protein
MMVGCKQQSERAGMGPMQRIGRKQRRLGMQFIE